MKKIALLLFATLALTSSIVMADAFPPAAMMPQPPQVSQQPPPFLGNWTLGFYNGAIVQPGGTETLQYSELSMQLTSIQQNPDGSVFYTGTVGGQNGSLATVFYNPKSGKKYAEVYLFVPMSGFGTASQFLQVTCRVFIAPDGEYFYGTMEAGFKGTRQDGSQKTESLYHSNVDIWRQNNGKG